jgi:hypothetical protein
VAVGLLCTLTLSADKTVLPCMHVFSCYVLLLFAACKQGGNAAATLTDPSPVMCLSGMVTISDLLDDTEYEDICQDVKEECQQYGPVQ